ncbi:preprotein translocase subunit SecA [Candidatus Woesebacteria bacterium]|nr:preprotein translocase subunit SecA [Candidatus Woesebacteria bacterium]
MLNFLKNFFDENKKTLDKYGVIVNKINSLEPELKKFTNKKLKDQTSKFKSEIAGLLDSGKTQEEALTAILPEAFATVREASRRVLNMRHYDVQLLAGIALHYSNITEQKTGEGKTLTVTAPLYLNALLGKGAHLVTVNDYLSELGCGWMGPVYEFLGMTTSVIVHDHSKKYNSAIDSEERGDERLEHFEEISRKDAYSCDITYGTNNEFGFDYLRDNMVQSQEQMVQRVDDAHQYAIVDEADSILIDEARTPLIISAPDSEPTRKYIEYSKMVTSLTTNVDYIVDEKARTATLTDLGVKRVEQKIGVQNLYEESFDTIHHIESALKAKALFFRDKNYVVKDGEVIIVDEHTGRLMYGRRYSDGLHQAIEAKEGAKIQQESRTLATVSIQNYFRQYIKLSGMTGTALTESEEFNKIYEINVLGIPTNVNVIRQDKPDIVYKTTSAKYSAIVKEIQRISATGQPVMVGTKSIENNHIISNFLKKKKITHSILDAKNHEKEAFVIADAGKLGAITVATNIAGRGVDIVLGGSKPELKDYRKAKLTKDIPTKADLKTAADLGISLPPLVNPNNYKLKEYSKALADWRKQHEEVVQAGGLYIIGTERHESRRIDNQLRGRSGRQGDPGSSQFFVSLEDEIMRIFGGEQISKVMDFLKIEEDQPIEHAMIGKSLESAQVKVEGFFFDQRKRLVEFDDVMNRQRDIIYKRRKRLLIQSEDKNSSLALSEQIGKYIDNEVTSIVTRFAPEGYTDEEYRALIKEFSKLIPFDHASQDQLVKNISEVTDPEELIEKLSKVAHETYQAKEKAIGNEQMRMLEKIVTLTTLDQKWMDHLDSMDSLKQGIWLRGDKRTVLSEYKKESFTMFEDLIQSIESTITNKIYRVQFTSNKPISVRSNLEQAVENKQEINSNLSKIVSATNNPINKPTNVKGSLGDLAAALQSASNTSKTNMATAKEKIKRNDPCPCGSGKKYKKCGLIGAPEHRS